MNIGHDEAIVRYIIDLCCNEDVIQYYENLHDHNQKDDLLNRKHTILNSNAKMIEYYRNTIGTDNTCLYNSLIPDYFRYITSRWRLSNHKLKIETLRYDNNNEIPRNMRICNLCLCVEDEKHVIFNCPRFRIPRMNFIDILRKNCSIQKFLNPGIDDVMVTASFLHAIEKIIDDG